MTKKTRALILSVAVLAGFSSCSKPVIQAPPPITVVIYPSKDFPAGSVGTIEGILGDSGLAVLDRTLSDSIFEGIRIPASGDLPASTADQIASRSHAQILIFASAVKNPHELAYINGAYKLTMRWIELPSGKVMITRVKALYFMPRVVNIKEVMEACMEAYREQTSGSGGR